MSCALENDNDAEMALAYYSLYNDHMRHGPQNLGGEGRK
jgi:hypothetical protein